ncbi:MAG: hypothetical protein HDQ92_03655 [Desulfovibrio sp.]|nr:hypothetical protein [Desulfovibrio sp.]
MLCSLMMRAAFLLLLPNAEIIRQKQPFCCWLRQRKISLVEYLSTLPAEIFIFLASSKKSYFLGFFRHQHPSSASLQTGYGIFIDGTIWQFLRKRLASGGASLYMPGMDPFALPSGAPA